MKNIHRWFAVACLATASLVGCVSASTDAESEITASASQTSVVRYTAEDLARLTPTDVIRIDLTVADTVYIVEYMNPVHLEQIVVVDSTDQYLLSDRVTTNVSERTVNRVVLSGDPELAAEFLEPSEDPASAAPADDGIGTAEQPLKPSGDMCCDNCTCSGTTCVCTGCVPC